MNNLYEKSKLRFALTWILSYVVGASCADELSRLVNTEKSITLIFLSIMSAVAIVWMKRNGLFYEFGLCKSNIKASKLLYYIPLIIIVSCNLWFGVTLNSKPLATAFIYLVCFLSAFWKKLFFAVFCLRQWLRIILNLLLLFQALLLVSGTL